MRQADRRSQARAWAQSLAHDHTINIPSSVGDDLVPGHLLGWCQKVTRSLLQVGPGYTDAKTAYAHVAKRDRTADRDFSGIPGYFDIGQHGHAVLMLGDGMCGSTDILRSGRYDIVKISLIEMHWGARWLGGAFTINGVRCYGSDPS
jgi:hypothetical protein